MFECSYMPGYILVVIRKAMADRPDRLRYFRLENRDLRQTLVFEAKVANKLTGCWRSSYLFFFLLQ